MAVSRRSKVSLQQKHRGIVVLAKFDGDKGFGFIEPAGSDGARENRIFFGCKATQGMSVERGDECDFVLARKEYPGRNKVAHRIWITKSAIVHDDAVTTLPGQD